MKTSSVNKNTTDEKTEGERRGQLFLLNLQKIIFNLSYCKNLILGLKEENNLKKGLIEDEFNIEPLQPAEKLCCTDEQYISCVVNVDKDSNYSTSQVIKNFSFSF